MNTPTRTASHPFYFAFINSFWAFPLTFLTGFYLLYTPQSASHWLIPVLQLIPWVVVSPFLGKHRRKTILWFTLLGLTYLLVILSQISTPWPRRGWLLSDACLISFCITSALLHLRATNPRHQRTRNNVPVSQTAALPVVEAVAKDRLSESGEEIQSFAAQTIFTPSQNNCTRSVTAYETETSVTEE